jgi:predicted dehydrogenase
VPLFSEQGLELRSAVSAMGISAQRLAERFRFGQSSADPEALFSDPETDTVLVATRHDSHARYALRALRSGRAVWVEKPLALKEGDLDALEDAARAPFAPPLMVGFNRRFSPLTRLARELLRGVAEPLCVVATVNAGAAPEEAWVHDPEVGGGRILGEGCHFVDLLRFLVGAEVRSWHVSTLGAGAGGGRHAEDRSTVQLRFADGSIGSIHHFANGHRSFPMERIDVCAGGRILQIDDFRSLSSWGWPRFSKERLHRQDKGHGEAVRRFVAAVREGAAPPIPLDEILEVSRLSVRLGALARAGGGDGSV